jgi:hypothetical protein
MCSDCVFLGGFADYATGDGKYRNQRFLRQESPANGFILRNRILESNKEEI